MLTIIKLRGIGRSTIEISKHLGRGHCTVMKYVQHPDCRRGRSDEGKFEVVCKCTLSKIKLESRTKLSSTSNAIFDNAGAKTVESNEVPSAAVSYSSWKTQYSSSFEGSSQGKCLNWASEYMKLD